MLAQAIHASVVRQPEGQLLDPVLAELQGWRAGLIDDDRNLIRIGHGQDLHSARGRRVGSVSLFAAASLGGVSPGFNEQTSGWPPHSAVFSMLSQYLSNFSVDTENAGQPPCRTKNQPRSREEREWLVPDWLPSAASNWDAPEDMTPSSEGKK